jgi:hypothetical protein
MENKYVSLDLPYGEPFKKCWHAYVKFVLDNDGDASTKIQNIVLKKYVECGLTEDEAIHRVHSSKDIIIKYLLK